jgi:hypothetical protein
MKDDDEFEPHQNEFDTLSVFCDKYDPATPNDATDYFSSKEIQSIVQKHTGKNLDLTELHQLMLNLKYQYRLEEDEFKWLVKKV